MKVNICLYRSDDPRSELSFITDAKSFCKLSCSPSSAISDDIVRAVNGDRTRYISKRIALLISRYEYEGYTLDCNETYFF